jgi:hypothetical protein
MPIPKAGMVLALPSGAAPPEGAGLAGAAVDYRLPVDVWSAMAGGPMLLNETARGIDPADEELVTAVPPYTFAADETLDQNLLPRMVAGLTATGALIVAAIDGRDFTRGVGMTLEQCRSLLQDLGCTRGMNLDGGDSKRMVVRDRVVDLPSSQPEWGRASAGPAEVRPVYSAVLLGAGAGAGLDPAPARW